MNSEKPLVSVVISCYNSEKYVEIAIQSILDQTYRNLEIFITDDCSTDGTYTILEKLAAKDERIILLKNEKNLKLAKSLNNMIALAKGKYIARMDADDISMPRRIEKQVVVLETHPEYAMCGTNAWVIDEKGKKVKQRKSPLSNEEINIVKYYNCPFLHPTVLIRREIIQTIKYNEEFNVIQDYELWFRILSYYKAINLKEYLLEYRVHSECITITSRFNRELMYIRMFADNLTNNDILLSEKYVYNFLHVKSKTILVDNDLEILLVNQLHKIKNAKRFNYYILKRYFKYFFYRGQLQTFFKSLPIKENIRFLFIFFGHIFLHPFKLISLLSRMKSQQKEEKG
jgi:glycosyltransferase involved in cell wall biosynthesis